MTVASGVDVTPLKVTRGVAEYRTVNDPLAESERMLDALWVADALALCNLEPDAVNARLQDVEAQALLEEHLDAEMD